jgi:endonuclease/exonuclease/phosphatase family metal-dependent hydrolase
MALTSRNWLAPLRGALAEWNPDLIASNEGGSNMVLVRPPWRVVERERITLARWPERRRMLLVRARGPGDRTLVVASAHLSVPATGRSADEALRAARHAVDWSSGAPLILGGDLNLRAATDPATFEVLEDRFGLEGATAPKALDHLLARGLEVLRGPEAMSPATREVPRDGLAVRLSDHAPVAATFGLA